MCEVRGLKKYKAFRSQAVIFKLVTARWVA